MTTTIDHAAIRRKNIKSILSAMDDNHVDMIRVDIEGSTHNGNDFRAIDVAEVLPNTRDLNLYSVELEIVNVEWSGEEFSPTGTKTLVKTLESAVEYLAREIIESTYPHWASGRGCKGNITFDSYERIAVLDVDFITINNEVQIFD